jgi:hypothetical protein
MRQSPAYWQGACSGEDEKEGSDDEKTHDVCLGGPAWPESELDMGFYGTRPLPARE